MRYCKFCECECNLRDGERPDENYCDIQTQYECGGMAAEEVEVDEQ